MELLHVAEGVAREKHIDKEIVIEALEEAIQKAARSKYGYDKDIRASIDRQKGAVILKNHQTVVEQMPEPELNEDGEDILLALDKMALQNTDEVNPKEITLK